MQRLYCGMTDFSVIDRHDPYITIYGDTNNSTIKQSLIENIRLNLDDLKQVVIDNITKIENRAFANLGVSQFELILPDTLTYIGDYAFMNCGAMNTIIIPSSVTYLGVGTFHGCASLDYIYFREGITITEIPTQLCYGGALKCIGTIDADGNTSGTDTIVFPDSITSIADHAFEWCSSLGHSIIISDNVTHIGDYAFYGTSINNITLGTGLATGSSSSKDNYQDANYTTERTITVPYTLYLTSKRQFRYKHFTIDSNHEAGFLYRLNDDDFKYCLKNSHLLVFKNGLLLPPTYYYLHSIVNTPINDVGVIFNVELAAGDVIDVFYVTNDLHHLECDYYDMKNKERYIKNGSILLNTHSNEYRVMGEQMPNENINWRTNYIKMRSPLYAISSKHSTFVFLNGKKVRFDELEDISDTIMSINTDYARNNEDMNAVRLEVINHLDTQDIIEQLFINDGLNHDDSVARNQFTSTNKPNAYKDTLRIKHWSITDLESYAERTLLDEMLNDLSDENLNKLFYNWNNKTGPMTPYDEEAMNEPDFINPDEIIPTIIDEYYFEEDGDKFIWHTIPTTDNIDGESNTVFYIGEGESVRVPVRWNGEETRALYGTTFNRNKTIRKVIIPEGVTSIE